MNNIINKDKWIQKLIDIISDNLQKPETKELLYVKILDPAVSYIMSRLFPYMILTIILFAILLILVILIFITIFFNKTGGGGSAVL